MNDDAAIVTDVSSALQGGYGCGEAWQPAETLRALVAAGCRTLIPELIATFKADAASRMQAMDNAIASGNLPLLRVHIHTLKGCARQLGADKMAVICEQIESADPDTLTRELPGQLKELEAVYGRVVRAMDTYV